MKNTNGNYYSGGFAEIVSNPSEVTYFYLKQWFNGKSSLGKAMKILGLPHQEIDLSILELIDGELVVDLQSEEKILYKNTVFKYAMQKEINNIPKLVVDSIKLLNPLNWIGTVVILIKQSIWISSPKKVISIAKELVKKIPEVTDNDKANIEQILKDDIWPQVIVLGILSEFFNQLIKQDSKVNFPSLHLYISRKQSTSDWFFLSILKQYEVKDKKFLFKDYITKYGKRADIDYELICPRWYEIKDMIQSRIEALNGNFTIQIADEEIYRNLNGNLRLYVDTLIELQIIRSEAKRKALLGIDILRKKIKPKIDLSNKQSNLVPLEHTGKLNLQSGLKGQGVSAGVVWGMVKYITEIDQLIPEGCICIFPNASPQFSIQYPKCKGIIFLKGGQTSHGSIVAREFGIPAIIESGASGLKDGVIITIDGIEGTWMIGKLEERIELRKPNFKSKQHEQKSMYFNPLLGGKASALKKMSCEGLPIPEFFVIDSEKFQNYDGKELPEEYKKEIIDRFYCLNTNKVAVRSSALNEDSTNAAWAGQLESYLNVSKKDLINIIQKCWNSIKTKRVEEYIKNKNLKDKELLLAVIIQKMVKSDISGVIFTANPVNKNNKEIVIEASLGFGENVVGGKVTPSRYLIDKERLNIKDKFLQSKPLLDDGQIKDLVKLALKIERIFNCPQDIEWAIEKNKIYILQSRPITTL